MTTMTTAVTPLPSFTEPGRPDVAWLVPDGSPSPGYAAYAITQYAHEIAWDAAELRQLAISALLAAEALEEVAR